MTANDHGHINNLDRSQTDALKEFWIALTKVISTEMLVPIDQIVNSIYGAELISAIGYDNPDTFLLRRLRISKWNIASAVKMVIDMLEWRQKWGVQALLAKGESAISYEEITTGKAYFMGRDKVGRPIHYVHAKSHIKGQFPIEATEKYAVWTIEAGRKLVLPPAESIIVIFDLAGFGVRNMDIQHVKFFSTLVENHYPDSLGIGLVINAPWLFSSFWTIIKQLLDPVIVNKIRFVKSEAEIAEFFDPRNLPKRMNGNQPDFQYMAPTAEDEVLMTTLRADTLGKENAQAAHSETARHYLNVTLQWANGDESQSLLEERTQVTKQLHDTFEQLVPYINTRTHYHRTGDIDEPIFNITYNRIRSEN
ncbi:hypothetical protein I4U23_011044 [Adineta vaga]|nr:hypothetical protein I4U23_011044 [Adineta vaga]